MNFQKIRGTRLYEGVVNQIFDLIASGQLGPGHQLPSERPLAQQLGVSRNVLREAVRALEWRGIVISVPGGGRFIRPENVQEAVDTRGLIFRLESATVQDILESRELVETQVVMLAANRAGDEDWDRLRDAASKNDSWEDNLNFHVVLASLTRNLLLPKLVRIHLDLLQSLNQRGHYEVEQAQQLLREHSGIAEAVIAKDAPKASRLMQQHFRNTRRLMGLE